MKLEVSKYCPLVKGDCKQLGCSWFTQVRGKHPQTGEDIDQWGCAITWLPILMIENSQQQRQTGAAVESFRNEMAKTNENFQDSMHRMMLMSLTDGPMKMNIIGYDPKARDDTNE